MRVMSRGDLGSSSVGSGLYVPSIARGGSGGGTVPSPWNAEMPWVRTDAPVPPAASFSRWCPPFLPPFFVSWDPGTLPLPSPCQNHQISSPSYEPGRLPAGQCLQNSWRLLKVSERFTTPPDLGQRVIIAPSFLSSPSSSSPAPLKFLFFYFCLIKIQYELVCFSESPSLLHP